MQILAKSKQIPKNPQKTAFASPPPGEDAPTTGHEKENAFGAEGSKRKFYSKKWPRKCWKAWWGGHHHPNHSTLGIPLQLQPCPWQALFLTPMSKES